MSGAAAAAGSYLRGVEDQHQSELNLLFSVVQNPHQSIAQGSKPFRERDLPLSFFKPPSVKSATSSSSSLGPTPQSTEHSHSTNHQHTKNQLSLPNIPSPATTLLRTIINNNQIQGHLRTVSDTAVLDGGGGTIPAANGEGFNQSSQQNSQYSMLPLPDQWEVRKTNDGRTYFFDQLTQNATWTDPRPAHYTAFTAFCATLPLPTGYESSVDDRGNVYYIDHIHKQTFWDDPRPDHYRAYSTRRLDIPPSDSVPSSSSALPSSPSSSMAQQVPSPVASTSSSPYFLPHYHTHQHRSPAAPNALNSLNSLSGPQETLKQRLSAILTEQRILQQRKEELEKMEAEVRKMLSERIGPNPTSSEQANIESLINELLHHKRQNSEDSGVGEGRSSINRTPDALSSVDGADELFLNATDYGTTYPADHHMELAALDQQQIMHEAHLKLLPRPSSKRLEHIWRYEAKL